MRRSSCSAPNPIPRAKPRGSKPCALSIVTLSVHTVVWGGAIVSFGLAMQAWVLKLAPEATDLAVSIYSGLYNVGIGAGALLGNHIANGFGVSWVGTFGGVVGVLGAALCWLALRMYARAHLSDH